MVDRKMKAITGFELLLIGIIGTYTIITAGFIPPSIVKLTEEKETLFEYSYNKVQLILLNLLSATHEDKKIYQWIGESIAIKQNLEFLKEKLDKIVESKCYQLSNSTNVLIFGKEDCELNYFVNTSIVLPYNPNRLIDELRVGIR